MVIRVCEAGRPFVLKATFLWRHDALDREVAAGQSTAAQRAEREINLLGELRDAGTVIGLSVSHPQVATIEAATRIEPHVLRTPLLTSDPLSGRHGADIAIKCEHLQRTGSFKVRGSANVVHSLSPDLATEGVITASSGNHGIGVATAAASRGFACTIYLPEAAAPSKIAQIRRLGAEIVLVEGTDTSRAEMAARRAAEERGVTYVSPYNDQRIIAGQGTIGKEMLEHKP